MKKMFLVLLLPFAFAMPSCTDTETAVGVGLVGGALIGASIGYNYGDSYYYGYNRPYYGCVGYSDYWGRYSNECGYGYNYGYGYHNGYGWKSNVPSHGKGAIVSGRAAAFATKNHVSFTASERLVKAFDTGAKGDFSGLSAMGLTKTEFVAIAEGHMPSSKAMSKLSAALNLNPSQVTKMMKKVVAKVQERRFAAN